ncbi:MAG: 1-(5-phosphoribosyl)-5-[(5-phosphoribosylamino)methylideneamino]imidazole-4-carboxamide isomerase [Deinococcus sp.]|nr:1-(5-phosphoribosyl)-5-[(5-phosphoribosylamino)methylideneamino]imidazole-4-carboxamide isomerase [Deinococcus sp.]
MVRIIPAVDIQGGRAVRLTGGDYQRAQVYFDSPLEAAQHWAALGAELIHVVDLDRASGRGDNRRLVKEIIATLQVPVQVGGGVRNRADFLELLDAGARWVVLGTAAVENPALLKELVADFPDRVAVALDARVGRVTISGWCMNTALAVRDLAPQMEALGVRRLIYTDAARDGTLGGLDLAPIRELVRVLKQPPVVGGGVASNEDIARLDGLVREVIVGKALYEGRVSYPRTA